LYRVTTNTRKNLNILSISVCSLAKSIDIIAKIPKIKVNIIFSKNLSATSVLKSIKGICEINANISILVKYFFLLLVCIQPSVTRKAKIGNDILPKYFVKKQFVIGTAYLI